MHKIVAMTDLYPVMEETLHNGGIVTLTSTGTSMLPMLGDRRDTVVLEPVTSTLHVNDVVLYRRDNGQFVLHRIVGLESNGDYVMCGDNQFVLERCIAHHQVIGRLQAFTHKGCRISCGSPFYKAYLCLLPTMRFLRHGYSLGRKYMSAILHRVRRRTSGSG